MRTALLIGAIVLAIATMLLVRSPAPTPAVAEEIPELTYVTTAHQFGVVGYRDPFGAISPDGSRFAYTEGRFIRVVPVGGGSTATLAPGDGQVRYVAWKGNGELVGEDITDAGRWWSHRLGESERRLLWDRKTADELRQLTFSADGALAAAVIIGKEGPELWRAAGDGSNPQRSRLQGRVAFPAFRGSQVACIVNARLSLSCDGVVKTLTPDRDVVGPIAFSPGGDTVYFASPNDRGMVELWSADVATGAARRLSSFARDAYAPSVASNGTTVFKVQSYRTTLADVAVSGGPTRQLTTFQSETPSYHPTRPLLAFTYGTWRRVMDDAKYPDIAQEIGVIEVAPAFTPGSFSPATQPSEVLEDSDSEDQAMTWSPNGKWIAFHTHRENSDDVWLRPADGSQADRRITMLGRGAEVGWPRWSPDGTTVLLNGARKSDGASVLYTIGVDQETGATSELRELVVTGVTGEMGHAEWLPASNAIVGTVKEGPGRHAIFTVSARGGEALIAHRFATEHDFSGLGVSPDGRYAAFAAPAPDGYFQIFTRATLGASPVVQVTSDPSNKTQPTFSPDGQRIAFTVWSYEAAFWAFTTR